MRFSAQISLLASLAALCPNASAYYHFIRYLSRTGPFVPIEERWDVNALPNKTLNFYISDQGPTSLAANDSLAGVISQIRLAARVWSDVDSSDLRLNFGGIAGPGASQNGPGIDVIFSDDLPPGLVAQGGITSRGELNNAPGGPFVPINRSIVMLRRNLADRPSYSEAFFLTATHEFGHAIGLQHTLSSSIMSTEITRATTKAKPLSADDIAAVSLLYPARNFPASTGSISGRVTMGSDAVNLASVVAIPPTGGAVSALTNPDGTYRIEGIPPGQYHIYVHPLPPALQGEASRANIVLPLGPDGRPFTLSPDFDTQFFPGTKDAIFAVAVTAGSSTDNISFQVQRRASVPISSVQTYGFIGQVTTKPPLLNRSTGRGTMVAAGVGLLSGSGLTPGLLANPIGGAAGVVSGSLRPYQFAPSYVQMDLNFTPFTNEGSHHLIFSAAGDIYVLPSAFYVTGKAPPSISGVANTVDATGARVVAVFGAGFDRETRILFDGHPAAIRSFDEQNGRLAVTPPPAPASHRAVVVAANSDGQSSLFAQGSNLTTYTYDAGEAAVITISPAVLAAGSEMLVEVTGSGLNLIDGLARLGFGSSEITVRRVWTPAPNRLLANVSVASNAALGPTTVSVVNGLQMAALPFGLTILPANPRQMIVLPTAVNPITGQAMLQAGNPALVLVLNLPAGITPSGLTLTLNDFPIPVAGVANGQVTFQIPAGTPPGPAVLRLRTATDSALPVALHIESPPPAVIAIQNNGLPVDAARPVRPGDTLTLLVTGLVPDAFAAAVPVDDVTVTVGAVEHTAQQVSAAAQRGLYEVVFTLKSSVPLGVQPLTVSQDGRASSSVSVPVR